MSYKSVWDLGRGEKLKKTKLKRSELKPATNLKEMFCNIRDYLAGNVSGITRDETLAQELINLLFCKIYDENHTLPFENVTFIASEEDTQQNIRKRIDGLFEKVKTDYHDVFFENETISLDTKSLIYVIKILQYYSITSASREVIGEAFEVFIGPALRGGEGQFFTPKNVVEMTVGILNIEIGDLIIDPACGSGGFLTVALSHLWNKLKEEYKEKIEEKELMKKKEEIASNFIRGIDKDRFLAKVTKAYLALIGDGRECIFCENSLDIPEEWNKETKNRIEMGKFDVVITNPPFGAKIPINEKKILSQYELGHVWSKYNENLWIKTDKLQDYQPPQILFIERCLQLLKSGGRMGIVLPDGILSNISDGYIRQFILENTKLLAIVDCPPETFQPSTATKTSILFLEKVKEPPKEDYKIFMSIIKNCGHDKRGRENRPDELPLVVKKFKEQGNIKEYDRLGFFIKLSNIKKSNESILAPKYYNPEINSELEKLKKSGKYELISINELIQKRIINIKRGNEIGSKYYGLGGIPFVRTSDISNWEIRVNPETCVDEDIYIKYARTQDLKNEDILFVNDGGRMVGEAAIITPSDEKMLIQSHLRRIRILKKDILNPYLLLYLFKMPIVEEQIESKRFVQATIPSLGNRLLEVILPIPKDKKIKEEIISKIKNMILKRAEMKKEVFDFISKEYNQ
jgi:type I restriction enzyme M protein